MKFFSPTAFSLVAGASVVMSRYLYATRKQDDLFLLMDGVAFLASFLGMWLTISKHLPDGEERAYLIAFVTYAAVSALPIGTLFRLFTAGF